MSPWFCSNQMSTFSRSNAPARNTPPRYSTNSGAKRAATSARLSASMDLHAAGTFQVASESLASAPSTPYLRRSALAEPRRIGHYALVRAMEGAGQPAHVHPALAAVIAALSER